MYLLSEPTFPIINKTTTILIQTKILLGVLQGKDKLFPVVIIYVTDII